MNPHNLESVLWAVARRLAGRGVDAAPYENDLVNLFHKYGPDFEEPRVLGMGVESEALGFKPDKILKLGPAYDPKFSAWANTPLDGRLEPDEVMPLEKNQSIQIFPKALMQFDDDLPIQAYEDMQKVQKARWLRGDKYYAGELMPSLFANSYKQMDLHDGNVGYIPGRGLISIDEGAGLAPLAPGSQTAYSMGDSLEAADGVYPRQGHLVGDNVIGRFAEEILNPPTTRTGPVTRKLLASYPREVY